MTSRDVKLLAGRRKTNPPPGELYYRCKVRRGLTCFRRGRFFFFLGGALYFVTPAILATAWLLVIPVQA